MTYVFFQLPSLDKFAGRLVARVRSSVAIRPHPHQDIFKSLHEGKVVVLENSPESNRFFDVWTCRNVGFAASIVFKTTPGPANIAIVVRCIESSKESNVRVELEEERMRSSFFFPIHLTHHDNSLVRFWKPIPNSTIGKNVGWGINRSSPQRSVVDENICGKIVRGSS